MLRRSALTVLIAALAVSPCFGQEWAKKMFKETEHDFGTVARGAKAEYRFVFENIYLEDIHIAERLRQLRLHERPRRESDAENL